MFKVLSFFVFNWEISLKFLVDKIQDVFCDKHIHTNCLRDQSFQVFSMMRNCMHQLQKFTGW